MGSTYNLVRRGAVQTICAGCPFAIRAWSTPCNDYDPSHSVEPSFDTFWTFTTVNNTHNHPPCNIRTLAPLRKLTITPEIKKYILDEVDNHVPPRQLLLNVQKHYPSAKLLHKDIQNMSQARRHALRAGHTSTEAIIHKVEANGELFKPFLDQHQQLIGLVYTTRQAHALLHRFPTVLNGLYVWNKHIQPPMLHIIGFTSTNQTYTAAAAFLTQETSAWYSLALTAFLDLVDTSHKLAIRVIIANRKPALHNALVTHLPDAYRLYCRWHLGENIKAACKSSFIDFDHWEARFKAFRNRFLHMVTASRTEDAMKTSMDALEDDYAHPCYQKAVDYHRGLLKHKESFISAYIDEHPHLGQTSNSRLEGNHHSFKSRLGTHKGDLYTVIDTLRDHLEHQWTAIQARIGLERTHSVLHPVRMLAPVKARVSCHAICLVNHQIRLADRYTERQQRETSIPPHINACLALGDPCAHTIMQLQLSNRLVRLSHFHRHWHLGSEQELDLWAAKATECQGATLTSELARRSAPEGDADGLSFGEVRLPRLDLAEITRGHAWV